MSKSAACVANTSRATTRPLIKMATVQQLVVAEAQRQGIDPALALAVARTESSFNQSARSHAGAIGVMQLMPGTAADLGVNPYDLENNISGGLRYLKQQLLRFGSVEKALWAYNGGPGRVLKGTIPAESRAYSRKILSSLPAGTSGTLDTEFEPVTIAALAIGAAAALSLLL